MLVVFVRIHRLLPAVPSKKDILDATSGRQARLGLDPRSAGVRRQQIL